MNMRLVAALVAFAGLPASAGEWVEAQSLVPNMRAIVYESDKMLPGEQVTLYFSGMRETLVPGIAGEMTGHENIVMLEAAFDTGSDPITGFGGVSLRAEPGGDDIESWYATSPERQAEDRAAGLEYQCHSNDLDDIQVSAGLRPDQPRKCHHACFATLDDLRADRRRMSCEDGRARWIHIVIIGRLVEEIEIGPPREGASNFYTWQAMYLSQQMVIDSVRSEGGIYWLAERLGLAQHLMFKVRHGNHPTIQLQIDDTFRRALWNPS